MFQLRLGAFSLAVFSIFALALVMGSGPSFRPTNTFKGSALTGWHVLGDATWTVTNGEITGTPTQPAGGWLVLDQSFQDVGFFATYKCSAGCATGVLIRAEKTPTGGMKGVFLSLDAAPSRAYAVTLDAAGKELTRAPWGGRGGRAAGTRADAPAGGARAGADPAGVAQGRAAGPRSGREAPDPAAGFSGRARGPVHLTTPLPADVVTNPAYKPGDWNDVEVIADATNVRVLVNDGGGGGGGGQADDAGRFGPIALFVAGTGAVSFKNVAYRDLLLQPREPEKVGRRFKVQQLSDFYYSWGVSAADFNRDGILDVVSGPHIFYGPDYTTRREIYVQQTINPSTEYSNAVWMQFSSDLTGDGWPDALNCGQGPGCVLYVNPGKESRRWDKFPVTTGQSTEIAVMTDVDGDGRQDIVFGGNGIMQWATPDPANPTGPWKQHVVSEYGTTIAHGVGAGDINGDGRVDILDAYGWWEQPAPGGPPGALWTYHPVAFSRSVGSRASNGGALMAVYDVNDDGLKDVVTSLSAHGYGLAWYEQKRAANGDISFVQHMIMDNFTTKNAGDVIFTEPHGSAVADVDGDGVPGLHRRQEILGAPRYLGRSRRIRSARPLRLPHGAQPQSARRRRVRPRTGPQRIRRRDAGLCRGPQQGRPHGPADGDEVRIVCLLGPGHHAGGEEVTAGNQRRELNGRPVIGSAGVVGAASQASRLSTTSITPYMRTQWPGNVHAYTYSPASSGAVKFSRSVSPSLTRFVACTTSGPAGTYGLTAGSEGICMVMAAVPNFSSAPGSPSTRLCGMVSGLKNTICTGFPCSTTNHFTVNCICSGRVSIPTTCTPRARRSRRTAVRASSGSEAASRSPNWIASTAAGSVR